MDRTDANARTELGMMYMQWGNESKARDALDAAWSLDPYNERTKFTLELLDKLHKFAKYETDHFIIKFDAEKDPGLGEYVAILLLPVCAFFLVAASLVPGSDVLIRGVGVNPTRTGLLDLLRGMGADLQVLDPREEAGEPVADLRVRTAALRGVTVQGEDIPRTIDEFPVLCVAAALAEGMTVIKGAEELRVKESDRIATMAAELRKMGAAVTETPDGLVITGSGGRPLRGAICASHGDHRVAMSMAVAGLVAEGQTTIQETGCVETSFPGFEAKLSELLTR